MDILYLNRSRGVLPVKFFLPKFAARDHFSEVAISLHSSSSHIFSQCLQESKRIQTTIGVFWLLLCQNVHCVNGNVLSSQIICCL